MENYNPVKQTEKRRHMTMELCQLPSKPSWNWQNLFLTTNRRERDRNISWIVPPSFCAITNVNYARFPYRYRGSLKENVAFTSKWCCFQIRVFFRYSKDFGQCIVTVKSLWTFIMKKNFFADYAGHNTIPSWRVFSCRNFRNKVEGRKQKMQISLFLVKSLSSVQL